MCTTGCVIERQNQVKLGRKKSAYFELILTGEKCFFCCLLDDLPMRCLKLVGGILSITIHLHEGQTLIYLYLMEVINEWLCFAGASNNIMSSLSVCNLCRHLSCNKWLSFCQVRSVSRD